MLSVEACKPVSFRYVAPDRLPCFCSWPYVCADTGSTSWIKCVSKKKKSKGTQLRGNQGGGARRVGEAEKGVEMTKTEHIYV